MGQLKDLKPARRPPRLKFFTAITPPYLNTDRVNSKDKYSLTPARAGVITVYSDGENEKMPSSRARTVKRERSRMPPRVIRHGHQSGQPRVKRESSLDRHGPQQICEKTPPAAAASGTRRAQVNEPLRRRGAHVRPDPPSDSSSSSDSSESDTSDSSESEDEANASVYRPSTPASSIASSPLRTRRKKEAGAGGSSANPVTASPPRRSVQSDASIGSGHAPLNFFIEVPALPPLGRPELAGRSRSHISPAIAPTGAQVDRTAHSSHQRPTNSSPVVLGFMPINRGSPPPQNAPTEPRAMRTGEARPAGTHVRSAQRPSESNSGPVSGSSSLPFRGARFVKDNSQQKGQQRRGPARPGRIMQTIEQPIVESLGASSPPKNLPSSHHLRVATPGPSSRRTAPPPASPGIFVTPRAVSVRSYPVPRSQDSPQSVSRPQGKRPFGEIDDTDSTSKAAERERMLERIKNHDKEMEQQRAQLEDMKRQLAEQKTRIDDLEQRRRAGEPARDRAVQTRIEEPEVAPPPPGAPLPDALPLPNVAPLPDVAPRGDAPRLVDCGEAERSEERRRENTSQAERRDVRKRRNASRVARARLQEQERHRIEQESQEIAELEQRLEQERRRQGDRIHRAARRLQNNLQEQERQRIEQERQEDVELEQQLDQEQRNQAERVQRAASRLQNQGRPGPSQTCPEMEAEAQRRIQHDIFTRSLSGHNPRIRFDDDDRPHISKATAFLMRLRQDFVLAKLRQLVRGRDFFDVMHPGCVYLGCWVVSRRASCDLRMKLTHSGETHSFSFARLAVRLWHEDQSLYSLLEHNNHQLKAGHTCHTDACMRPDHIVVESDRAAGERRGCKRRGWCSGHADVHKDGTRQVRKPCIFPPQGAFVRR